jgi:hypothetical protein
VVNSGFRDNSIDDVGVWLLSAPPPVLKSAGRNTPENAAHRWWRRNVEKISQN